MWTSEVSVLSIKKEIFLDDLKITKVTPIYKADDKSDLSNYRPISVLSRFPKNFQMGNVQSFVPIFNWE